MSLYFSLFIYICLSAWLRCCSSLSLSDSYASSLFYNVLFHLFFFIFFFYRTGAHFYCCCYLQSYTSFLLLCRRI
ncbi:hypothetical protein T492DRAFT_992378 [Pavlovales sp. CCMP2436]|nr:hypothetical protein T492DRAFT_992378 [Pavlovales sp. CCMP2436]